MNHLLATLEEFKDFAKDKNLNGKTILDIGCKDSDNKIFFERFGLLWEGIDIKPHIKETQVIQADMCTYNSDKQYDILFVCHSLEHCERPVDALRNFHKLLKDDGYLFISLPCYCDRNIMGTGGDYDHIFVLTDQQLIKLLMFTGFKKVNIFNSTIDGYGGNGQYNMIAIAEKNNPNYEIKKEDVLDIAVIAGKIQ